MRFSGKRTPNLIIIRLSKQQTKTINVFCSLFYIHNHFVRDFVEEFTSVQEEHVDTKKVSVQKDLVRIEFCDEDISHIVRTNR